MQSHMQEPIGNCFRNRQKKKKKKKIPHRPRSVAWELIPFTVL